MFATADRIGVDADECEQARNGCVNTLGECFVVLPDYFRRSDKRLEDRDGQSGVAARRVDAEVSGVFQALDALAILAPLRESFFPELCLLRGIDTFLDPRREVFRREVREGEE